MYNQYKQCQLTGMGLCRASRMTRRFARALAVAVLAMTTVCSLDAEEPNPDHSQVPGVVIPHSPASSGIYIGSPGIAILPDGSYLAKQDEFGPQSTEKTRAVTHVYRSAIEENRGSTCRVWTACSGRISSVMRVPFT